MGLNDLKCIKVTSIYNGNESIFYLSYNDFYRSFVVEKWKGEKRTKHVTSIFGYYHTHITVKNPYNGLISYRYFDFPNSVEQAEKIHNQVMEGVR